MAYAAISQKMRDYIGHRRLRIARALRPFCDVQPPMALLNRYTIMISLVWVELPDDRLQELLATVG